MPKRREVRVLPGALQAWRRVRGEQWNPDHKPLSQKQLSDRTAGAVSATLIGMIETGERQPSRLVAEDLARALDIPVDAFAFIYPHELVSA